MNTHLLNVACSLVVGGLLCTGCYTVNKVHYFTGTTKDMPIQNVALIRAKSHQLFTVGSGYRTLYCTFGVFLLTIDGHNAGYKTPIYSLDQIPDQVAVLPGIHTIVYRSVSMDGRQSTGSLTRVFEAGKDYEWVYIESKKSLAEKSTPLSLGGSVIGSLSEGIEFGLSTFSLMPYPVNVDDIKEEARRNGETVTKIVQMPHGGSARGRR